MSIFGKLRRAKQAADTQKDKNAAKAESAPYKHIPTHAATDALLGAPATWRERDRKAIQAQHQRRSEYNLSRNPSSLSNVTTLNRDQSFTSAGTDPRKRHSRDWVSAINVPYRSQLAPIAAYSSRMSQPPAAEQPSTRSSMRRSRFDSPEPEPRAVNAVDVKLDRPYPGALAVAKDVKFYLPSSREISPSHSSENSNSSSRDSSFYEPPVPARHPRRPITLESSPRKFDDQNHFQQQYKNPNRRVGECPRLSVVPSSPDGFASAGPVAQQENDLSFIDFGRPSSEIGYPVMAH